MTRHEIKELFKKHGGAFHGLHVEHASIEEEAFYQFAAALIKATADRALELHFKNEGCVR